MLNYVWLGLIILGIGTALVTDISDQSRDKYKNGETLPAHIILYEKPDTLRTDTYNATLIVEKKVFNSFYSAKVDSSIEVPALVTYNPHKNSASFVLKINKSARR